MPTKRAAKESTQVPDQMIEEVAPSKPLADLAKWGGRNDTKLLLSPEAIKKVTRKSLSPSTADAMSGCSARWAIEQLLPRHEDPFGPAELGSSGHRVFEMIFAMPKEERTIVAALDIVGKLQHDVDGRLAIPSDPADLDRWHNSVTKMVTGLWAIENPREIDVVGLELHMTDVAIAGGVPFNGYIDRLRSNDEGEIIGDYKTGKVPNTRYGDKHGDQIRTYGMARAAMDGCTMPVGGEVLYTQHEERHMVDFSPSAMEATAEKFSQAWRTLNKQIDSAEFATKISGLCGWCPAVDVCPAAIKEGKVAKKEGMAPGVMLGIGETAVTLSVKPSGPTAAPAPAIDASAGAGQESSTRGIGEATATEKGSTTMSEPKPWEETNDDGSLNYNSYGAIATFGIVSLAVEILNNNEADITASNVTAFASTLTTIIDDVYVRFYEGQTPSFAAGLHTRLRGALRTALETIPAPFGGNNDAWDKWVHRATVRTFAIAKTATTLWERGETPAKPWGVLAVEDEVTVPADDFADA